MLNRATLPGTTARTAGMRAPRPPDPMQQYVTAAMKDDERRAHNIASAQALAAVPVTGPEATLLGRLGQTITVPRAETDRLLNTREPAALPAAYVPDQAHENSISVLKVLKLQTAATKLRAHYAATGIPATLQRKPSGPPETSQQPWDRRQGNYLYLLSVSVADTSATT
jgi:hypothetical protein